MCLKPLSLLFVLCIPVVAQAQEAAAPTAGQVEISRTKVSDIPSQYRSDALKPRKPFAVRYTCPDAGRVYVVFDNAQQTATLEMGNTTRYLKQGVSGSGARYVNSDESYVFWVKGNEATINGRETCVAD
ncbi:MAG: MliC family protein [Fluviibacter sp.]